MTVPADVDLLFTAPFLDVAGNALGLYDSISWGMTNHFFNWMLITAAAALVLEARAGPPELLWPRRRVCGGPAIAWELAEYVTFIRFSPELSTAYDTLGDLTLGRWVAQSGPPSWG